MATVEQQQHSLPANVREVGMTTTRGTTERGGDNQGGEVHHHHHHRSHHSSKEQRHHHREHHHHDDGNDNDKEHHRHHRHGEKTDGDHHHHHRRHHRRSSNESGTSSKKTSSKSKSSSSKSSSSKRRNSNESSASTKREHKASSSSSSKRDKPETTEESSSSKLREESSSLTKESSSGPKDEASIRKSSSNRKKESSSMKLESKESAPSTSNRESSKDDRSIRSSRSTSKDDRSIRSSHTTSKDDRSIRSSRSSAKDDRSIRSSRSSKHREEKSSSRKSSSSKSKDKKEKKEKTDKKKSSKHHHSKSSEKKIARDETQATLLEEGDGNNSFSSSRPKVPAAVAASSVDDLSVSSRLESTHHAEDDEDIKLALELAQLASANPHAVRDLNSQAHVVEEVQLRKSQTAGGGGPLSWISRPFQQNKSESNLPPPSNNKKSLQPAASTGLLPALGNLSSVDIDQEEEDHDLLPPPAVAPVMTTTVAPVMTTTVVSPTPSAAEDTIPPPAADKDTNDIVGENKAKDGSSPSSTPATPEQEETNATKIIRDEAPLSLNEDNQDEEDQGVNTTSADPHESIHHSEDEEIKLALELAQLAATNPNAIRDLNSQAHVVEEVQLRKSRTAGPTRGGGGPFSWFSGSFRQNKSDSNIPSNDNSLQPPPKPHVSTGMLPSLHDDHDSEHDEDENHLFGSQASSNSSVPAVPKEESQANESASDGGTLDVVDDTTGPATTTTETVVPPPTSEEDNAPPPPVAEKETTETDSTPSTTPTEAKEHENTTTKIVRDEAPLSLNADSQDEENQGVSTSIADPHESIHHNEDEEIKLALELAQLAAANPDAIRGLNSQAHVVEEVQLQKSQTAGPKRGGGGPLSWFSQSFRQNKSESDIPSNDNSLQPPPKPYVSAGMLPSLDNNHNGEHDEDENYLFGSQASSNISVPAVLNEEGQVIETARDGGTLDVVDDTTGPATTTTATVVPLSEEDNAVAPPVADKDRSEADSKDDSTPSTTPAESKQEEHIAAKVKRVEAPLSLPEDSHDEENQGVSAPSADPHKSIHHSEDEEIKLALELAQLAAANPNAIRDLNSQAHVVEEVQLRRNQTADPSRGGGGPLAWLSQSFRQNKSESNIPSIDTSLHPPPKPHVGAGMLPSLDDDHDSGHDDIEDDLSLSEPSSNISVPAFPKEEAQAHGTTKEQAESNVIPEVDRNDSGSGPQSTETTLQLDDPSDGNVVAEVESSKGQLGGAQRGPLSWLARSLSFAEKTEGNAPQTASPGLLDNQNEQEEEGNDLLTEANNTISVIGGGLTVEQTVMKEKSDSVKEVILTTTGQLQNAVTEPSLGPITLSIDPEEGEASAEKTAEKESSTPLKDEDVDTPVFDGNLEANSKGQLSDPKMDEASKEDSATSETKGGFSWFFSKKSGDSRPRDVDETTTTRIESEEDDLLGDGEKQNTDDLLATIENKERQESVDDLAEIAGEIDAAIAEEEEIVVELVWRDKQPLGMTLLMGDESGTLRVADFPPGSQAHLVCEKRNLPPDIFEGATILAVDGQSFKEQHDLFEALRDPARPKSVKFRLADLDDVERVQRFVRDKKDEAQLSAAHAVLAPQQPVKETKNWLHRSLASSFNQNPPSSPPPSPRRSMSVKGGIGGWDEDMTESSIPMPSFCPLHVEMHHKVAIHSDTEEDDEDDLFNVDIPITYGRSSHHISSTRVDPSVSELDTSWSDDEDTNEVKISEDSPHLNATAAKQQQPDGTNHSKNSSRADDASEKSTSSLQSQQQRAGVLSWGTLSIAKQLQADATSRSRSSSIADDASARSTSSLQSQQQQRAGGLSWGSLSLSSSRHKDNGRGSDSAASPSLSSRPLASPRTIRTTVEDFKDENYQGIPTPMLDPFHHELHQENWPSIAFSDTDDDDDIADQFE